MELNYKIYLYNYHCPRWFGTRKGLKNLIINKDMTDEEVINLAKKKSNFDTGSKSCDIYLLQQFESVIKPIKSYSNIAGIDLDTNEKISNLIKKHEIDKSQDYN